MFKTKIYEDSINYTCQVIKLPVKQSVNGLDNLVKINYQGNDCLISKDSDINDLYLFFPSECKINHEFLSINNLYRNFELNNDKTKKGFFEDNGRVKAIKFKGVISSGFVIPLISLSYLYINILSKKNIKSSDLEILFKVGDEFNEINGIEICKKYYKKLYVSNNSNKNIKLIDELVDSKMIPEHFDTEHLMKNTSNIKLDDYIAITYKLHGTSARYYNSLVKRKLNFIERVLKYLTIKIQTEHYDFISASRRVLKSINLKELSDKNHYYNEDLWTKVGKEYFYGKLNHGEAVYCEIIGKDYTGSDIQQGYTYGFDKPKVYIYRISNINSQGIEVDLSYQQMKERAIQLGIETCSELFYGKLKDFIYNYPGNVGFNIEEQLSNTFYNQLLEKPSILDNSVIEEGFCLRIDKYPKPKIYKIKSKSFLLYETKLKDKDIFNIEENQV